MTTSWICSFTILYAFDWTYLYGNRLLGRSISRSRIYAYTLQNCMRSLQLKLSWCKQHATYENVLSWLRTKDLRVFFYWRWVFVYQVSLNFPILEAIHTEFGWIWSSELSSSKIFNSQDVKYSERFKTSSVSACFEAFWRPTKFQFDLMIFMPNFHIFEIMKGQFYSTFV